MQTLAQHFTFVSPRELAEEPEAQIPQSYLVMLQLREAAFGDLQEQFTQQHDIQEKAREREKEFGDQRAAKLEEDERERKAGQTELWRKEAELQQRIAEFETRESKLVRRDLQGEAHEAAGRVRHLQAER